MTGKGTSKVPRVLITTVPFGEVDPKPLRLLEENGIEAVIQPLGRRLREEELADLVEGFDGIIAGTEPISERTLERGTSLQIIARVGRGLDNVPLAAARKRGILLSYTPDAPADAAAEFTMGQMLAALRHLVASDQDVRSVGWRRRIGRRLGELTVGIVGVGRIGRRVVRHLSGFSPARILGNDLVKPDF